MENNKERIMECAEELFYTKGYDAAGVQEIVDRSGITKPTLYYYFGSKLGLLEKILEAKFGILLPMIQKEAVHPEEIKEKLYRLANVYCDFFMKERNFYQLMMALFYSARENEAYQAVSPYFRELYQMIVALFEGAADQLGNMNGRQELFALSYIGILNQYLMIFCEQRQESEGYTRQMNEEQVKALVNQFMHGIFS